MGCGAGSKHLMLEVWKGCNGGCKEYECLGVKINEDDIKNRINKGRAITSMLNSVLWNTQITRKNMLQIYNGILKIMELKYGNLSKN